MSVIGLIGLRCDRACHDGRIVSVQREDEVSVGSQCEGVAVSLVGEPLR